MIELRGFVDREISFSELEEDSFANKLNNFLNDSEIEIKENSFNGEDAEAEQENPIDNMPSEEARDNLKKKIKELEKLTLKTAKLLRENEEIKQVRTANPIEQQIDWICRLMMMTITKLCLRTSS